MNKFWVIVGQVYKKNVKSFGFLTMVFAPVIIMLIIGIIVYFVSASGSEIPKIAVLSDSQAVHQVMEAKNDTFEVDTAIQSAEAAEEAMQEEEIAGYLTVQDNDGIFKGEYISTPGNTDIDIAYLTSLLSSLQVSLQAKNLGLTQEQVQLLVTPAVVERKTIEFEGEGGGITAAETEEDAIRMGSAYVVGFAIFLFIMTYAGIIGEEIASEKGTRIMEVILSSVTSTTHFFGKLIAIFLICLTQIAIYGIIAVAASQLSIVKDLLQSIDLSTIFGGLLGTSILYLVLGIVLYTVLSAFLGSLVTKVEDVSKSITPIVFLALAGFYAGLYAFYDPTNIIVKVGSYIPVFTPFIMPFRIASNTISTGGITASIIILILFTILTLFVSLALYRSSVLIYSDAGMWKTMKISVKSVRDQRKAKRV